MIIKKPFIIFVLVITMFSFLNPITFSLASEKQIKWKLATLAPKGIGWAKHVQQMVLPAIKKATDGHLKWKFYWGGVMGDDEDYVQKMRIGQLQGMGFSAQGLVIACPEMAVLELPFLFRNYQEVDYIRKTMYPTFDKIAEKHGFKLLYLIDQDFDQIYSVNYKMNKVDDFKSAKFLTWYGTLEQEVLKSLGSSPVPVNVPEISPSIRQGVGDAYIGPALWTVGAQMYSVVKYVNPVKIRYSPGGLMVTQEAWNEIPKEYQDRLLKFRTGMVKDFCSKTRADSEKALNAMIKYGVKEVTMSPEELEKLKAKSKEVWYQLAGTLYPKALLDELLGHLEEFRAGGKS